MRTLLHLLLWTCAMLAAATAANAASAAVPSVRLDHTHPLALNEFAMQKVRAGDRGTAILLLERAVLLAPHDTRIRNNLEVLRAVQAGKTPASAPAATPADIAPVYARPTTAEPALPAVPLWPLK